MTKPYKLNSVFDELKPSSTLHINEMVNEKWQRGEKVFHMGFGESRFNVHKTLQQALKEHAHQKSYLPARGLPELNKAVANYYSDKLNTSFKSQQVIVGPGSKSLIYGLQMILAADVFLPTPSWVSYAPQATLLGNRSFYIPSSPENNYKLEINELDKLVKKSKNPCKLLIINSPNNPTGQMLSDEFLQELAKYCRANDILVLSDEIYFQVSHGDIKHVSISKYYPEGTFVLGGLSKHLSIGGWRLGVALLPDTELGKEIMKQMVVFASETWSGVSAPIQYAAIEAYSLKLSIEQYVAECSDIHGIRTRFFQQNLKKIGVVCSRVEGAFYIAVNFDGYALALQAGGIATSTQLAHHLLERYKIASLPGSDFGIPEATLTLRLSTSYLDMESNDCVQRIFDLYQSDITEKQFMSEENHPLTMAAIASFKEFVETLTI